MRIRIYWKLDAAVMIKIIVLLGRKCLQKEIVYHAEVNAAADGEAKYYTGLTEPDFKKRFGNHKKSFEHLRYSHETTLTSYVWEKKNVGIDCNIKWKVLKKARAYNSKSAKCYVCLEEKVEILKNHKKDDHLNKRSELFSLCRHRKKWLLGNVTRRMKPSISSTICVC